MDADEHTAQTTRESINRPYFFGTGGLRVYVYYISISKVYASSSFSTISDITAKTL